MVALEAARIAQLLSPELRTVEQLCPPGLAPDAPATLARSLPSGDKQNSSRCNYIMQYSIGHTAHIYDDIAPKLAEKYHVFGITRRGYGASSSPASGYTADRLGDDVIDVLDSLKIVHPVLVGHSIAGEELSSVGTRYPTRIAGLVYLDAGYLYAYQNPASRDLAPELDALQKRVEQLTPSVPPTDADLTNFSTFRAWQTRSQGVEFPEASRGRPLKPPLMVISPILILSQPLPRQSAQENRSSRTFGFLFSQFTLFPMTSALPSASLVTESVRKLKRTKPPRLAR